MAIVLIMVVAAVAFASSVAFTAAVAAIVRDITCLVD